MNRHSAPTSSDETTASSAPSQGFICTICFKVFPTGQALGGHQNAHLLERSFRQTPNILGAVLNHPLPQEDVQALAGSNSSGHHHLYLHRRHHHHQPPIQVQQPSSRRLNAREDDRHLSLEGRVRHGSTHFHPFERVPTTNGGAAAAGEGSHQSRRTKNLLAGWKQVNEVKEGEMNIADPCINLELELSLKPKEYIDLNLKLGF